MAYLRGTRLHRKAFKNYIPSKPVTIRNKIQELERKVNRIKPEKQFFRYSASDTTSSGCVINDENVSNLLLSDAGFRDKVTGDKWFNTNLRVRFTAINTTLKSCRVIVYVHKRGTSAYNFPVGFSLLTEFIDPSQCTCYYDRTWMCPADGTFLTGNCSVPLNFQTLYNSETSTFERGCVRVAIISASDGIGATSYEYELAFNNI